MQRIVFLTTLTAASLLLAGCAGGAGDPEIYGTGGVDGGKLIGTINHGFIQQAGSSTVLPIAQAWADDFGSARGVQIKVAGGGSGAGGKGLCEGTLDIGDQSRPLKQSEFDLCAEHGIEPVAWTVAFDGLSVVVSDTNPFVTDLSVEQLVAIFGTEAPAQKWSDVDPSFPTVNIQACAPDAESGTYDYFNEEILHEGGIRGDAERSADDNALVTCVAGSDYAIGFFGYAYLTANADKIKAVAVDGVLPTPETIENGQYTPLSRPIFMVTNGIPAEGSILHDYFSYAYHPQGGQPLVEAVGYIKLSEAVRQDMLSRL